MLILYYEVIFLFKQKILQKELHQVQQMLIKHRGYQSQKNWKILKKRFGKNAILKGMNLEEGATAKDRNAQIGGHKA